MSNYPVELPGVLRRAESLTRLSLQKVTHLNTPPAELIYLRLFLQDFVYLTLRLVLLRQLWLTGSNYLDLLV